MFHKIRNPDTGNWVNITGTTGKTVLRKYLAGTRISMTGGSSRGSSHGSSRGSSHGSSMSPPRPPRRSRRQRGRLMRSRSSSRGSSSSTSSRSSSSSSRSSSSSSRSSSNSSRGRSGSPPPRRSMRARVVRERDEMQRAEQIDYPEFVELIRLLRTRRDFDSHEDITNDLKDILARINNSSRKIFVNKEFSTMRQGGPVWTPLKMACFWCAPTVIELLADNGAEWYGSELNFAVDGAADGLGQLKYIYPPRAGGQIPEERHAARNHILRTVEVVLDKYEDVITFEMLKDAAEVIFPRRPCRQNNQDDQDWDNIEAEYRSLLDEAADIYGILLPELSKETHRQKFAEVLADGWDVSNWYYQLIR